MRGFTPRNSDGNRVSSICQCGRIVTTQPLKLCVTCSCGARLHTKGDASVHARCKGVMDARGKAS